MQPFTVVILAIVASVWSLCVCAEERPRSLDKAVTLWLEGKPDEAQREIESKVLAPAEIPGRGDTLSAALRNLGARIHLERYQRLRGYSGSVREAFDALEAAKAFASAAVWESPYEIEYWRDFIKIGALDPERGTMLIGPFIGRFNTAPFAFKVEGRKRFLSDHPELRRLASAVSWEQRGNIILAEQLLQSWLDEPTNSAHCAASIVLADLHVEMDHFATAQSLLEDRARTCGSSVEQVCAAKVARIRALLPDRRPEQLQSGHESLVFDAEGRRVSTGMDIQSSLAADDDNPLDIANRLLRDPTRMDDWHRLWETAGTDAALQRRFDQVLAIVQSRPGASNVPEIVRAQAYRHIELGKFAKARKDLETLVIRSAGNADAELLVATLLLDSDAALSRPLDPETRLNSAKRADPYIVACIDEKELARCHSRRRGCAPPAIVCDNASEFIYDVWTVGVTERPHALQGTNQLATRLRGAIRLNEQMIRDTEMRLIADIQSREDGFARRIAAIEQRVDVIVEVRMAEIEQELRRLAHDQDDFKRLSEIARAKLRRDVQTALERAAAAGARAEYAAQGSSEAALEVARLKTQHQADISVLRALCNEIPRLMQGDRQRFDAVIAKLAAAVEELQRPELSRHLKVLRNWRNEPWDKITNSTAFLLDEVEKMAMALILPGKQKLLVLVTAFKVFSDLVLDRREQARKSATGRSAQPR